VEFEKRAAQQAFEGRKFSHQRAASAPQRSGRRLCHGFQTPWISDRKLPDFPSWVNTSLRRWFALLDQLCQSDETRGIENRRCFVHRDGRGIGLIGPLTRNGKIPEDRSLEKKRVDTAYSTAFVGREMRPTERVE